MLATLVSGSLIVPTVAACGGASAGAPSSPSLPPLLRVGGAYLITKTITENTCDGNLSPATGSGVVTHTPGALTFTLNDSFSAFAGNLLPGGAFAIPAQATPPHLGAPVTTAFDRGQFTVGGFEASVRLDIDGPRGQPPFAVCRVSQIWRATKQGAPNVIP
jgi:hypothetical protein